MLEAMTEDGEDIIDCMARMKAEGHSFALATVVRTEDLTAAKAGAKALIREDGTMIGWVGGGCTQAATRKVAARTLADGRARLLHVHPKNYPAAAIPVGAEQHESSCPSRGTVELFVEPILPRPLLVVVGASPTARALCRLGRTAGFTVTVAALSGDQGLFGQADRRLEGFDLSQVTGVESGFIVVATQGKRDREALTAALSTAAPYVAFVGSQRKAASLREKLLDAGVAAERVAALRSPAGLDLGAVTPEEVALSILAEVVQLRRQTERREAAAAQPEIEKIEGGSFESQIVSPVTGVCQTKKVES